MTNIVRRSFGLQLSLLRILGFFPPKVCKWYIFYTCFIYCIMIIPISVLSVLNLFMKETIDLAEISDDAFLACQMACLISKLLPFVIKTHQIRASIENIECRLFTSFTKNQQGFIDDCIWTCKRNSLIFFLSCICSVVTWAVRSILRGQKRLPLELWLPIDFKERSKFYYAMYVYVIVGVTVGAFSNGIIDPLIAGLAYHATTQLRILKNNLQFFLKSENESDQCEKSSNILRRKITQCIKHHIAILGYVYFYESIYSMVVFSQFVTSVFVICISCFCLSIIEPFSLFFFAMIIFLITMLVEIFLYCYYGTLLHEENNTLTTAAYMGSWYNYDNVSRRLLLVLMERSKQPMVFTAGKILDVSLATFTTILRRAYSLLAVLKNYQ